MVGNKLGAINHTLLTIEALKTRKMKIVGIVFNNLESKGSDIILKDNPKIIEAISGQKSSGSLSWDKNIDRLHKNFRKIGKNILSNLR